MMIYLNIFSKDDIENAKKNIIFSKEGEIELDIMVHNSSKKDISDLFVHLGHEFQIYNVKVLNGNNLTFENIFKNLNLFVTNEENFFGSMLGDTFKKGTTVQLNFFKNVYFNSEDLDHISYIDIVSCVSLIPKSKINDKDYPQAYHEIDAFLKKICYKYFGKKFIINVPKKCDEILLYFIGKCWKSNIYGKLLIIEN